MFFVLLNTYLKNVFMICSFFRKDADSSAKFVVKGFVYDDISSSSDVLTLYISDDRCTPPIIDIKDKASNTAQAMVVRRNAAFKIHSRMRFECSTAFVVK